MFDHIFENRDKKVTNLIKLSDYLGRSLRENIEIFSIDDTENKVTFITESRKIIAASYNFNKGLFLENIQVENDDLFEDSAQFDEFVNYKISNFIQNIFEEDFVEADTSFNKVLQLWENRVKFTSVKNKLYEKSQKFNGSNRILESEEFGKLMEIAPTLVEFLKENKNLVSIPEVKNMVKLSSAVSHAFAMPRLTYDDINESTYTIPESINHSIYEMVCKQELIRKELVESKNNFNLVWLNNEKVSTLASMVYEKDDAVVAKALVEAICEVPYFALATKKQINDTITSNLELNESVKVIFEALAKLSPKGSVQKEVLVETAQMLKTKNGVESIDVNYFIELLFEKAEYNDVLEDSLVEDISIKETFSSLETIDELVNLILDNSERGYAGIKGGTEEAEEEEKSRKSTKKASKKKASKKKASKKKTTDDDYDDDLDDETQIEDEPRVDEAPEAPEAEEEPEVEEAPEKEAKGKVEDKEEKKAEKTPTSDEIMKNFKNFEDILNSINFEDFDVAEPEEGQEEEDTESEEDDATDQEETE